MMNIWFYMSAIESGFFNTVESHYLKLSREMKNSLRWLGFEIAVPDSK